MSMEIDPEQRFITECAKIAGLESSVKSLKLAVKKLSKQLDELQIQDFYKQIGTLNTRIDEMQKTTGSQSSRLHQDEGSLARLFINHHLLWALWYLIPRQDIVIEAVNANACIQLVRESAFVATEQTRHVNEPLPVVDKWYTECRDYFHKHGGYEAFG